MSLSTEDMLHGATLLSLIDELDNLDKDITYRISKGEKKYCYELVINKKNNGINLKIGLFIKSSRKRISPWRFTFSHDNQHEIERLLQSTNYLFLLLITDQEGVAVIDYPTLKKLLDDHFDNSEWISVRRKLRENYRVSGKDGKLDRALPKNAFPKIISEYIEKNINSDSRSNTKTNFLKKLLKKTSRAKT